MRSVLIDADYVTKAGKPVIRLILKNRRFRRVYDAFEPYFYAQGDAAAIMRASAELHGSIARPVRVESATRSLFGREAHLLRVVCKHPAHVPALREAVKKLGITTYEHNIPFHRRYMIDKGLVPMGSIEYESEGKALKRILGASAEAELHLKQLAFDIETYNPLGVPRPKEDPLLMVSYADEASAVLTYKTVRRQFVKTLTNERAVIDEFCRVVKEKDAEVLWGYNSSAFDLPYMRERAAAAKTRLALGRDGSSFKLRSRAQMSYARITGRVHLDLYHVVRFLAQIGALRLLRYTLGDVYAEMCGREKKAIAKTDIWRIWESDVEALADYSLDDAKAVYEIAQRVLPLLTELARITRAPLFDVCGASAGQLVEMLLISRSFLENAIVPNNPHEGEIRARLATSYAGGFVKVPEPGVYENIAVFDFRGLYPSIIVAHNIDPFTLNCDCCGDAHASPLGHRFCKRRRGLIPKVLEELIERRAEIKKKLNTASGDERKMLEARQLALKILANSFYGFLGYARSRWYSREAAESTTAWGRHYIQDTIGKAEGEGFKVLYSDTDSVMLLLDKSGREHALAFQKKINAQLPGSMELELEGFYRRGVFVSKKSEARGAKKKYALIDEQGKIKIRGFELVRRDWSGVAKSTQLAVLEAILREGSAEKAVRIVRDVIARLQSGSIPLGELIIYTQLKKKPGAYEVKSPELGAAQKGIKRGIPFEQGSLVGYVITKAGKTISEKAELAEYAKDYDAAYYVDNQVLPAVLKILKELGYKEEDLKGLGKQTNLGGW